MIALKQVEKRYGSITVLNDASLRIDPREIVCVAGKSGSGKTTAFKLLTGEEMATRGIVEVDGVDIKTLPPSVLQLYRQRLGIIFEQPLLVPSLTLAENVALPLEILGMSPQEVNVRVSEVLRRTDLLNRAGVMASALSCREARLASIARAFVHSPVILIADEPLLGLEDTDRERVFNLFREARDSGRTVIIFTQDASIPTQLEARSVTLDQKAFVQQKHGVEQTFTSFAGATEHRILETELPPDEEPEEEEEETHPTKAPPAAAEEPVAQTPTEEVTKIEPPKKKTPGKPGQRKIRITAINSEL